MARLAQVVTPPLSWKLQGRMASCLALIECQLKERIEIKKSYGDLPKIRCYPGLLNQVYMNIFRNSIQSISQNGTIQIITRREEKSVNIEITDTGVGIKEEHLKSIFEAFFTTKDSVKDVGLGLSVCYGFIQDHGGDIRASSQVGEGTTFTIILPEYSE